MYKIERFTIPEIVEKSSERYASRPALALVGGEALLYRDLEPKTRRIAALLSLLGIKKGDTVALLSENRPEWGLSYFGIVRAGAIAIPVMTDFTSEQISTILEHSESKVLIVSKRLAAKVPAEGEKRILLSLEDFCVLAAPSAGGAIGGRVREALDEAVRVFEPPAIDADDLASILYTSGTMGKPKGVMLTHRNFVYNAWSATKFVLLRRTDRLLSILPLAHSYEFTIGFLIPIMHGSAVYYLDRPPSATALLPALLAIRPTLMLSVPLVIEKNLPREHSPRTRENCALQSRGPAAGPRVGGRSQAQKDLRRQNPLLRHRRRSPGGRRGDLPPQRPVPLFDRVRPDRVGPAPHRQ